jgi:dolichol kinase
MNSYQQKAHVPVKEHHMFCVPSHMHSLCCCYGHHHLAAVTVAIVVCHYQDSYRLDRVFILVCTIMQPFSRVYVADSAQRQVNQHFFSSLSIYYN